METNYHECEIFVTEKGGRGSYIKNPNYIPGCRRTRLIQRMENPRGSPGSGFTFGGGLMRGGFSEKAWEILKDICTFDYMGAAEFEMGALPEAFLTISKANDLEACTIDVKGSPEFPWSNKMRVYDGEGLDAVKKTHELSTTVFVLAPKNIRPHVELTIRRIAGGDDGFLKERTRLRDTMFSAWYWTDEEEDDWARRAIQGWVELDNGYMFFADEDMWRNFCRLFLHEQPSFDIKVTRPDFASVDKVLEGCKKQK